MNLLLRSCTSIHCQHRRLRMPVPLLHTLRCCLHAVLLQVLLLPLRLTSGLTRLR